MLLCLKHPERWLAAVVMNVAVVKCPERWLAAVLMNVAVFKMSSALACCRYECSGV